MRRECRGRSKKTGRPEAGMGPLVLPTDQNLNHQTSLPKPSDRLCRGGHFSLRSSVIFRNTRHSSWRRGMKLELYCARPADVVP